MYECEFAFDSESGSELKSEFDSGFESGFGFDLNSSLSFRAQV